MRSITYQEIITKKLDVIFIDVRSESEYLKERIPNAINIPILNDEQRKIVGTIYKQESTRAAIEKGLELVGPNLLNIYKEFMKYVEPNKQLVIYCARGGMRSRTITSLIQQFSLPVLKLENGYKGYREYININLPILLNKKTFITLYGATGCGKTRLLKELKAMNYDILDLEACANHRGSLLGGIGLNGDHSQKYFESLVFDGLLNAQSDIIFCEGESKRIGSIIMLDFIYSRISGDYKILIEAPLARRIQIIKEEYISSETDYDKIEIAFAKLANYHGKKRVAWYLEQLKKNQSEVVIEKLIVDYYDKAYATYKKDYLYTFNNEDDKITAQQIISELSNTIL